jgi:hypothetical protein
MVTRKNGSTAAADPETSEDLRRTARERAWAVIERIGERNADKDPDEELAFITEVVEEVRQELYEQAKREKASGPLLTPTSLSVA